MDDLSNSAFLSYGDEGPQEWSPGIMVDLHGACYDAVSFFQSDGRMVFQRSTLAS